MALQWFGPNGPTGYRTFWAINGAEPKYLNDKGPRPAFFAPTADVYDSDELVVTEGFFDAYAGCQAGYPTIGLASSRLSEQGVEIVKECKKVILAPDADEEGEKAHQDNIARLDGLVDLFEARVPTGYKDLAEVAERADDPAEAVAKVIDGAQLISMRYRLDAMTARQLCDLPDPEISSQLLGHLAEHGKRTVIGAHTGEGKTTLCLQIVAAITRGEEFLGFKGPGGSALILDAEQGLKTVKRQLAEAGLDKSDQVHYIRTPDGLSLDRDAMQVAAMEEAISEARPDVVMLDPLYKLHSGDSNDERQAVDLMRLLDGWREEYGFALLLPVHLRKPPAGARFSIHEFFGSSAYQRGAEVVLGLQRLRNGYAFLYFFKDRDGDLPVGDRWGLLFDRARGFTRDPNDGKRETAADKVKAALEESPEMTIADLVDATGYAERTVRRALAEIGATEKSGPHNLKIWDVEDGEE